MANRYFYLLALMCHPVTCSSAGHLPTTSSIAGDPKVFNKTRIIVTFGTKHQADSSSEGSATEIATTTTKPDAEVTGITASASRPSKRPVFPVPRWVIEKMLRSHLTYRIGVGIHTYAVPVIVPVGLIGNTLSFLVMMQRKNRRVPCCMYMAALAVSDNVMMGISGFGWYALEFGTLGRWECKITTYIFTVCSVTSICLVLAMTFNRFLAVAYPLKVKLISTARTTKIVIISIVAFNACYGVPQIFLTDLLASSGQCLGFAKKGTFSKVLSWINIILNSILPASLLLIMNTRIIAAIRRRGRFLAENSDRGSKNFEAKDADTSKQRTNTENQLTTMLLLVAFALLFLSLPQFARYIVQQLFDYESDIDTFAKVYLLGHVTHKLYVTNSSLNFFLYCIGGSKFKKDLRQLFECCPFVKKTTSAPVYGSTSGITLNTVASGSSLKEPEKH